MPFSVEIHVIDVGQGESTLILVRSSDAKGGSEPPRADDSGEKEKEKDEKKNEEEEEEEEEIWVEKGKTEDRSEGGGGDGIVQAVLIDAGKQHAGDRVVAYLLNVLGERKLDAIVATHFDNDHVGGLASVFQCALVDTTTILYERCRPEEIPSNRDTDSYISFVGEFPGMRAVPRLGGQIFNCGPGSPTLTCVAVNGKVKKRKGFQNLNLLGFGKLDENLRSIALVLVFDQFVYFTGGDLGNLGGDKLQLPEDELGAYLAKLGGKHVCAFKCSHHGSGHGTSATFVERIRPRAAFISCGTDNTFRAEHHPAQSVINVLETGKAEGGDASPLDGHTIQKYYLTSCGYPRYFVNMPPGSSWPGEGEVYKGSFLEDPDEVPDLNPVLQDPFKADKEMARKVLEGCLDEADEIHGKEKKTASIPSGEGASPSLDQEKSEVGDEERDRVLALFDTRRIRRKSDFFDVLDRAGVEEDFIEEEYSPYRITYDYGLTLKGILNRRLDDDAESVVNRGGFQEVGVNWDYKKAVVAGGAGISGHLVLWVDSDGAANHRFLVHYFSREYSQKDEEPPMSRIAEHRCIAEGENVAPKNATAVVTVEAKEADEKVEGRGTWKPLAEGEVIPVWMVSDHPDVGGGDSLFHAILHGLGPEELDALAIDEGDELDQRISKLRNLTANEIEANADQRYGGFMVDPAEAARAIREMGSWDPFECDVALMALANVLGREILIDYPDRTELILPTVGHRTQLGIHCDGRDLYW